MNPLCTVINATRAPIRDRSATRIATNLAHIIPAPPGLGEKVAAGRMRVPTARNSAGAPPSISPKISRKALASGSSAAIALEFTVPTANALFVTTAEIDENAFDFSINRCKEIVHKEKQYDSPAVIIERLTKHKAEIAADLADMETMLA